jgi:hypothetical protein
MVSIREMLFTGLIFWTCGRKEFLPVSRQLGFWIGRAYGSWLLMRNTIDQEIAAKKDATSDKSSTELRGELIHAKKLVEEWQTLQQDILELRQSVNIRHHMRTMINKPTLTSDNLPQSITASSISEPIKEQSIDLNNETESLAKILFQLGRENPTLK